MSRNVVNLSFSYKIRSFKRICRFVSFKRTYRHGGERVFKAAI